MVKIGFRIDAIQSARSDQAIQQGSTFTTMVAAEEDMRTLFIHGARAATLLAKDLNPWVTELLKRRPTSVAVVGMANKIARTVWALVAHN